MKFFVSGAFANPNLSALHLFLLTVGKKHLNACQAFFPRSYNLFVSILAAVWWPGRLPPAWAASAAASTATVCHGGRWNNMAAVVHTLIRQPQLVYAEAVRGDPVREHEGGEWDKGKCGDGGKRRRMWEEVKRSSGKNCVMNSNCEIWLLPETFNTSALWHCKGASDKDRGLPGGDVWESGELFSVNFCSTELPTKMRQHRKSCRCCPVSLSLPAHYACHYLRFSAASVGTEEI